MPSIKNETRAHEVTLKFAIASKLWKRRVPSAPPKIQEATHSTLTKYHNTLSTDEYVSAFLRWAASHGLCGWVPWETIVAHSFEFAMHEDIHPISEMALAKALRKRNCRRRQRYLRRDEKSFVHQAERGCQRPRELLIELLQKA